MTIHKCIAGLLGLAAVFTLGWMVSNQIRGTVAGFTLRPIALR
jgi:hypothetical protein